MNKYVTVLDVGFTHCKEHFTYKKTGEKYSCSMRLVYNPRGYWYCIGCGAAILQTTLELDEKENDGNQD
jgi:hypothetical protein